MTIMKHICIKCGKWAGIVKTLVYWLLPHPMMDSAKYQWLGVSTPGPIDSQGGNFEGGYEANVDSTSSGNMECSWIMNCPLESIRLAYDSVLRAVL